ncbi:MAG: hypothetical protein R3A79_19865 [Nannocystaceae bacterium]
MLRGRATIAAALLLWVGSACILDNPGYSTGLAETGPGEASTTTAAGTTTTSTAEGTTTTSTTTGAATTGEVSTRGSTTTGEGSTSGSTGDETTGTTTGEPADCWGLDPDVWTVEAIDDAKLGTNPRSARLSPDGLSMVYIADFGETSRPFRAVRASLDDPFLEGAPVAAWDTLETGVDHPTLSAASDELFLSGVGIDANDVVVSIFSGGSWTQPASVVGVASAAAERSPSLSESGARLVHSRLVGPPQPFLMSPSTYRLFEATRPADSPPGTGFGGFTPVVLPGVTDDDYAHVFECGALAPDGLHLLFGSSFPTILNGQNASDALKMYMTARADLDAPWSASVEVSSLRVATWQLCPLSITRDGCVMTFGRFKFPQDPNESDPVRLFLARRWP